MNQKKSDATQKVTESIDRVTQFFKATESFYMDFLTFLRETDLISITVHGMTFPIKSVSYLEWLEWQRIQDLPEITNEDLTEDIECEIMD